MGDGVAGADVVLAVVVMGEVVLDTGEAVVDKRVVIELVASLLVTPTQI